MPQWNGPIAIYKGEILKWTKKIHKYFKKESCWCHNSFRKPGSNRIEWIYEGRPQWQLLRIEIYHPKILPSLRYNFRCDSIYMLHTIHIIINNSNHFTMNQRYNYLHILQVLRNFIKKKVYSYASKVIDFYFRLKYYRNPYISKINGRYLWYYIL